MMREIRTVDAQSKTLESYFEAFSFTGSNILELEAEVETCLDRCRPVSIMITLINSYLGISLTISLPLPHLQVQCQIASVRSNDDYEVVTSFGRKRRSVYNSNVLDIKRLTKVLSVRSERFNIFPEDLTSSTVLSSQRSSADAAALPSSSLIGSDDEEYFCFRPTTLAALSGLTLFLQVFILATSFIFTTTRNKKFLRY